MFVLADKHPSSPEDEQGSKGLVESNKEATGELLTLLWDPKEIHPSDLRRICDDFRKAVSTQTP